MIYGFCLVAFLQIVLAVQSLRGGFAFRHYFRRELNKTPTNFTPFATIFAPCRGLDAGFDENLSAIFRQNYPFYEIIFIVDSAEDAAVPLIEKLIAENFGEKPVKSRLMFAGKSLDEGQKIHNLREAVKLADSASQIFVFVDSDARPPHDWLKNLAMPLKDSNVGASTGYRWFIQRGGNFATHLRSVWNASIASALGANLRQNFCWGGAMAIRRETFERLQIAEEWRGAVSDDFMLTNALKNAGLGIYFVPQCLTASVEDTNLSEVLEFTTRQMKITRVYSPKHFKVSSIGAVLHISFWLSSCYLLIFGSSNFIELFVIAASQIIVFLLGAGKSYIRLKTAEKVFPDFQTELKRQTTAHLLLWIVTPFLFFYNNLLAVLSRRIKWRGTLYEMHSPKKTRILNT